MPFIVDKCVFALRWAEKIGQSKLSKLHVTFSRLYKYLTKWKGAGGLLHVRKY